MKKPKRFRTIVSNNGIAFVADNNDPQRYVALPEKVDAELERLRRCFTQGKS